MEMRAVVCVLKWLSFYFPAHQQVLLLLGLGFLIPMSVQKGFVFTARTEKKTTEISPGHASPIVPPTVPAWRFAGTERAAVSLTPPPATMLAKLVWH